MAKAEKKPSIKKFNFEVYELIIKDTEGNVTKFEDTVKNVLANHSPIVHDDSPIYLESFIKKGKFIFGTLTNSQMFEVPNAFDTVKQKTVKMPLKKEQGLAHPTSFLFDADLQMIVYENNFNGVALGSFCTFFETNYNIPYINTKIVIEPSDLEKFNKMELIKRFQVKVSKVKNGKLFRKTGSGKKGVNEIIDIAKETNSAIMDCTMVSGRKKNNSLNVPLIKAMVGDFLKYKESREVPTLIISGKESAEDKSSILNFILNKISLSISMQKQRFSNTNHQIKYDLIEAKYLEIRQSLIDAYKVN